MIYKENMESVKRHAKAFWEKELIDRPYLCVTAPKRGVAYPQVEVVNTAENCYKACMSGNYDPILRSFEQVVSSIYWGGDAVPNFEVTLGPDQYAGFLGARIQAKEGYITTWAEHCVEDWENFDIRLDKAPDGYFEKVRRFMEYAAAFGKDKFLVNMLDLHSNLDALSALRGPQELCFDIMDYPELVMEKLRAVNATYPEVYEMAYKAGNMAENGTIGWSPIYCEDKSAVIQCDFSCMLSPQQAREYVIPSIQEEASHLVHNIYHYDGKQALGHIDDVLAIKEIDCVQWVPGDGQPRTIEWMDLLHKIQDAGKSLWIYDWTAEEIKQHYKELKPELTAFSLYVNSQDEAEELEEYLIKNT